jgi:purine-binding chemotaxis protein CheW
MGPRGEERIEDALRRELDALGAPADEPDPLDEFFLREGEAVAALPELALPRRDRAPEAAPAEARREYLTFFLGREEYAVAIERIREILKSPPITEVPRAPAHVLGVVMVRGEVIPILDPRGRLGLPAAAPGRLSRVVVVDAGEGPCGLLVDAVSQVVRLPPSAVEARPPSLGGPHAEYVAGLGRQGDGLYILLDLPALLAGQARPEPAP